MATKKSSMGVGTMLAAVVGAVAGAVGMFLSDEDNRKKVVKEVKNAEKMVQRDVKVVKSRATKLVKKAKAASKKTAKKKSAKRR